MNNDTTRTHIARPPLKDTKQGHPTRTQGPKTRTQDKDTRQGHQTRTLDKYTKQERPTRKSDDQTRTQDKDTRRGNQTRTLQRTPNKAPNEDLRQGHYEETTQEKKKNTQE